jgi:GH24 family phage-related lysozyme (muramidase)
MMSELVLSADYMGLAEKFEGLSQVVYDDGAGILTIGIGHRVKAGEEKIYLGGMTIAQALSLLRKNKAEFILKTAKLSLEQVHELKNRDMADAIEAVLNRLVKWGLKPKDVPQRCLEVLVDLAFNGGPGFLDGSIAKYMRAKNFDAAILFSPMFCLAEDKNSPLKKKPLVPFTGLTLRRYSFVWYYFTGEPWRIGSAPKTRWNEVADFLAKLTALLTKRNLKNPLPYPNNKREAQKY